MSGPDLTHGRASVRDAVVLLLRQAVPQVQNQVFNARNWPTSLEALPAILVYGYRESAQLLSEAGGAPAFRVSATIEIMCRDEARDVQDAEDPETRLEPALEALELAVKNAILATPGFFAQAGIERCTSMETQVQIDSSGDRSVGDAHLTFSLQWQENWPPTAPAGVGGVTLAKTNPNGEPQIGATITFPSP